MIKLYLETLTILLTDIKQGIESKNGLRRNACLNKISQTTMIFSNAKVVTTFNVTDVNILQSLFADLYDKVKHYYLDTKSNLRKTYVNDLFQQIRSKLMELILFDSESGLKL